MSDLSNRLREWDAGVRRLAEQAEARIAEADALVRDLYQSGRVRACTLLGPVMSIRPYDPGCGPEDSDQVTQAVLTIPRGLGVVFWDGEDLLAIPQGKEREEEACRLFTPVAECRPLMRVQYLPFAMELVTRLVRRANGRR